MRKLKSTNTTTPNNDAGVSLDKQQQHDTSVDHIDQKASLSSCDVLDTDLGPTTESVNFFLAVLAKGVEQIVPTKSDTYKSRCEPIILLKGATRGYFFITYVRELKREL